MGTLPAGGCGQEDTRRADDGDRTHRVRIQTEPGVRVRLPSPVDRRRVRLGVPNIAGDSIRQSCALLGAP